MTYKVYIVEDHAILREALCIAVEMELEFTVCGATGFAAEALDHIPDVTPDLVLADLSLPGMNGLDLIERLTTRYPGLPVLVISGHDENVYVERALAAGARGYLDKKELGLKLSEAMFRVLQGEIYLRLGE